MFRHRFSLKADPPAPRPARVVILEARRAARLEPPCPSPTGAAAAAKIAAIVAAQTIIVGSGPAGLAAAAMLRKQGVPALVLEREADVAAGWRGRYDGLHLHTVRSLSSLPGMRLPRVAGPVREP